MDSKKITRQQVQLALKHLHQQIDSLKEKVDKLCENSGCFTAEPPSDPRPNEKK